jgi:hypothetical protein
MLISNQRNESENRDTFKLVKKNNFNTKAINIGTKSQWLNHFEVQS